MVREIEQMRDDFRLAHFSMTVYVVYWRLDEHALSKVEVGRAVRIGDAYIFANGSGNG
jgi:hypothetical protein